jgi:hypothetical protein
MDSNQLHFDTEGLGFTISYFNLLGDSIVPMGDIFVIGVGIEPTQKDGPFLSHTR